MVGVDELLRVAAVGQLGNDVGQVAPVGALLRRNQFHPFLHQRIHLNKNTIFIKRP